MNDRRTTRGIDAQLARVLSSSCGVATTDDASDARLIERVLGEYGEMPGLALTVDQAQRLWGCDAVTCYRIVDVLVERHLLRWSLDHRLMRADMELRARWRGREEATS